ncbi:MAG: glycosyltransferase, partial [Sedimentisphaerales bacterium]|nr:glycosyltransferase [Sedimentisphaerales bacterium]
MERFLNICLINTNDITGGAAKAAYRLHRGLRLRNCNSVLLVRNKKSRDADVFALDVHSDADKAECEIFSAIQKCLINNNRTDVSDTIFSLPYPGYDLSNTNLIRGADIINLHWVNYFQSVESIAALLSLGKPVVWTLHDQWAFTGGCHYSAGCEKYTQRCEQCPQLLDDSNRLPELVLKNKLNYFDNSIVVVSPSNWLAECARKSTLFKDCRIEVIPNGLDIDTFKPIAKVQAKRNLNINPETTTILFEA